MFDLVEPGGRVVREAPPRPPAGVTLPPATTRMLVPTVPGRATEREIPVAPEILAELVEFCYQLDGSREVEGFIADLRQPTGLPSRDRLRQHAASLAAEAYAELQDRAVDALAEVDDEARLIFLETLDVARTSCSPTAVGLAEIAPSGKASSAESDPLSIPKYRAFRSAAVEVALAAKAVQAAEGSVNPNGRPVAGIASAEDPLVALARAHGEFASAWARALERYPGFPVIARELLEEMADYEEPELLELAQDTTLNTSLDDLLRTEVARGLNDTVEAGARLRQEYIAEADKARSSMLDHPQFRPDEVFANQHPLWRYPMLVHAALERLSAGPGTIHYAAAVAALARAEEQRERDAEQAAAIDETLGWASLGFGVVALVPVVGQFAAAVALLLGTVQAIRAVSTYTGKRREYDAFGPRATAFGLSDPAASGLLVASISAAANLVPWLGVAGRFGGRLIRVTALQARVGAVAQDVLEASIEALAVITEAELDKTARLHLP